MIQSEIGALGEDIAALFLMKRGHQILHRNYLKKWGEIDIVSRKRDTLYFVEVKSVSCESVTRETPCVNPAEAITASKLKRLERVIQSYLLEFHVEQEWQIDALLVYIDKARAEAKVEVLHSISA